MKKKLNSLIVGIILVIFSTIPAYALDTTKATLTDEVLDRLTMQDYAYAYNELKDVVYSSNLTEEEKNQIAIEKYIEIYNRKMEISTYELPTSSNMLNEAEKKLVQANPLQASTVFNCALIASSETNSRYLQNYIYNDNGDAFRHMMWSALLTKEFSIWGTDLANGRRVAEMWTTAHEDYATNPPLEKRMDLNNNQVGRNLLTTSMNTNRKIADACQGKVVNGGGLRIAGNSLVATNGSGLK